MKPAPRHGGRDRAALAALAAAGCGLGPGEGVGEVELTVTRDYGAEPVLERDAARRPSPTR